MLLDASYLLDTLQYASTTTSALAFACSHSLTEKEAWV